MNLYANIALIHLVLTITAAVALTMIGVEVDLAYNFLTSASNDAIKTYILSFGSMVSGAFIGGYIFDRFFPARKISSDIIENLYNKNYDRYVIQILLFALAILFFLYFAGGKSLFVRSEYNFDVMPGTLVELFVNSIEQPLGLLPVIVNFILKNDQILIKKINKFYLLIVTVYLFGVGTKFSAIVVIMYFVAGDLRDGRISVNSIVGYFFGVFLFCLVMGQRIEDYYGVFSIIYLLPNFINHISDSLEFMTSVFASPVYIAAETASMNMPDWDYLFIEVSPLGGDWSGWYKISDYMRINLAIPFSGIGTLYSYGVFVTITYGVFSSLVINYLSRTFNHFFGGKAVVFVVLFWFMQISILSQYNLRSATRWLYYAIIICILFHGIGFFIGFSRRKLIVN